MGNDTLVRVQDVSKVFVTGNQFFKRNKKVLRAVDKVSFEIKKGETLGIVGESGCGKSTLGRCLLGLLPVTAGHIFEYGEDITNMDKSGIQALRRKSQIIFQDPYASLNPRMTVYEIIKEPLNNYRLYSQEERHQLVFKMMEKVNLQPEHAFRYPHEFSGGQRQRIVIARALILEPEFVVADEPVSALDVSVRSSILNLMRSIQRESDITFLFISHDLSVVKYVSDRIAVMYLGRVVEMADGDEIFHNVLHPYTRELIAAIPTLENRKVKQKAEVEQGLIDSDACREGCKYCNRCKLQKPICKEIVPELREYKANHWVACHLY